MALDPEELGKLLKPTDRAWAELEHATLRHRNGWELHVREVKFRAPYCTLITRLINDEEKELHFNTEAFANGAFVSIHVDNHREELIEKAIAKEVEEQQCVERARQRAIAERKERLAAEAAEGAATMRTAEAAAAAEIAALREAEENKKLEARVAAARRVEDWRKCLAARDVTRLTHFTRLQNLPSILKWGLYPATDFKELPEQPVRNDMERYDRRLDHVSLSVSHPNDQLFVRWHAYDHKDHTWVVLCVDPAVLWELPCSMFFANAAKGGGRTPINESEHPIASDFEKLFSELPDDPIRAHLGHAPMDTTNPQAEVMIRARIAPRYILGIAARSDIDLGRVRHLIGAAEGGPPISVERGLFDMRPHVANFPKAAAGRQEGIAPAPALRIDSFDDDITF